MNLEYVRICVIRRVNQAEHAICIPMDAPQEYVTGQQVTHTHTPTDNNTHDTHT